jgi:hypothetical protein
MINWSEVLVATSNCASLSADANLPVLPCSVLFDTECIAPELREAAMQYDNLVSYTERIRCAYFEGELTWEETASFGS